MPGARTRDSLQRGRRIIGRGGDHAGNRLASPAAHNPVARLESGDPLPHPLDNADPFVPEHHARHSRVVINAPDIGGANAAGGNADERFVSCRLGNRNVYEFDTSFFFVDGNFHGLVS